MSNCKVGDVVQLKSGGPQMTVSETNDSEMLECTWFDSSNELKTAFFKSDVVEEYKKKIPQVGVS